MLGRRNFLKLLGAAGVGSAFPFTLGKALASSVAYGPALPIPALLKADAAGSVALTAMEGRSTWKKKPTRTWGYNGPLLGPAISLRQGQKISMEVRNSLAESTAVHWHGLEVPGVSDGGPQAVIEVVGVWKTELAINQSAATCWFHPHPHAKTGKHVAMGLGGLLIIEDDASDALPLPRTWGKDDIPVILQDKRLNAGSQIDYAMDMVNAAVGWFGDFLLANGSLYPEHAPPRGWLRLRLLNACNARSLRLAFSDKRPMHVIASDGGFLPEPVTLPELTIYTGERFEVLVDCSDGKPFDLLSLPVRQMGMALPPFDRELPALRITPSQRDGHTTLPDRLVALPAMPELNDPPTRTLHLSMDPRLDMQGMKELTRRYGREAMAGMNMEGHTMHGGNTGGTMGGGHGGHGGMGGMGSMGESHGAMGGQPHAPFDLWRANMINGRAFTMNAPAFDVKLGRYERWIISGKGDMMLHPFHIHGTQFRILKENGAEPPAHRRGLKDTVIVEGKESEVLVRFMHPAPPERMYMAHCHLLEHEDTGMMLSFTVTP